MSDLSLLKTLITHPTVTADEARILLKKIGKKKSRLRRRERDPDGQPAKLLPGNAIMFSPGKRL